MMSFTKYAFAFVLAGGLATPALAAQADAGSGPTTGATSTNDAGSGPTKGAADRPESPMQHGQSELNANPAAVNPGSPVQKGETEMNANPATTGGGNMHIAQKLRADLGKAGFTNITIMPSSFLVRAKELGGQPSDDGHQSRFNDRVHRGGAALQFRQQCEAYGRKQQQRWSDAWTELDRRFATGHARRRQPAVNCAAEDQVEKRGPSGNGPLLPHEPSWLERT